MGLLAFTFEDEDGKALLTWEFAEKGVMWGMLFLFALAAWLWAVW